MFAITLGNCLHWIKQQVWSRVLGSFPALHIKEPFGLQKSQGLGGGGGGRRRERGLFVRNSRVYPNGREGAKTCQLFRRAPCSPLKPAGLMVFRWAGFRFPFRTPEEIWQRPASLAFFLVGMTCGTPRSFCFGIHRPPH